MRTKLTPEHISVSKGLIFRRRCDIPLSAVTKVEQRRTLLLRILRGSRVEISTLSGGVWFYIGAGERLPFLPGYDSVCIKAAPLQSIAGAFVDTRALSGVVTFGLLLNRIGGVFGSESFGRIMSLLLGAADEMTRLMSALHIAVPRVTAFAVVFAAAAWLLVFLHKAVEMLRFRVSCESGYITVRRGVFTLYECRLVRNNLTGIVRCDTLTTLLLRSAPLYAHDVMIFPPTDRRTAHRILAKLCGVIPPQPQVRPPFSALFGHCAAPLGWLGVFAGALLLTYIADTSAADLVQSVLWSAAAISLWFTGAYAVYMRLSWISCPGGVYGIAFRRGARLYTVIVPGSRVKFTVTGRNIFQRFSGMCDISLAVAGRKRCRLRNVPFCSVRREIL